MYPLTFTYRSLWFLTSTDQYKVMKHVQFMISPAGSFSDGHPCGRGERVLSFIPLGLTRHNIFVDSLIVRQSVLAEEKWKKSFKWKQWWSINCNSEIISWTCFRVDIYFSYTYHLSQCKKKKKHCRMYPWVKFETVTWEFLTKV